MPQPDGPPACGQVAHAPPAGAGAGFADTANTDRHFSTRASPHFGQRGCSLPKISISNLFPHDEHSYSNNGMVVSTL